MRFIYICLFACCITCLAGCVTAKKSGTDRSSAQKSSTEAAKKEKNVKKEKVVEKEDYSQEKQISPIKPPVKSFKERFRDTTYVYIDDQGSTSYASVKESFEEAVKLFDKGDYENACPKFEGYATHLPDGDPLKLECQYFMSECYIMRNAFEPAKKILVDLMNDSGVDGALLERCLIRLGQVYCVTNNKRQADKLFSRLKKEFPGSIYVPLADCTNLKSKK